MKRNFKKYGISALGLLASLGSMPSKADCCWNWWCPSVYLGVDAQVRHIGFEKNYGNNLFKKDYPQGNVFGGFKLNQCIGIEVGYEATITRTAKNFIPEGSIIAGETIPTLNTDLAEVGPILCSSSFQIKGWHADIMGFLPVCEEYRFDLIGSVGLARLEAYPKIFRLGDAVGDLNPATRFRAFPDTRKTVLRLGLGAQQMLAECVGIRFLVGWENTSRFNNIRSINPNTRALVKLDNSWNYGLGAFVEF